MSKPTYRELATNFTLWCKFVLLEEQVSEREFNEMSIDEKLDILQGCFGHEIREKYLSSIRDLAMAAKPVEAASRAA